MRQDTSRICITCIQELADAPDDTEAKLLAKWGWMNVAQARKMLALDNCMVTNKSDKIKLLPILEKLEATFFQIALDLGLEAALNPFGMSADTEKIRELVQEKLSNPLLETTEEQQIDILTYCIAAGNRVCGPTVRGRDIVVAIGNTGAGKSTFLNYLNSCELEPVTLPNRKKVIHVNEDSARGASSVTMPWSDESSSSRRYGRPDYT